MLDGFDISKADRRVTFQKPTEARDATYNQLTYGWTDVATVWATLSTPVHNRANEGDIGDKVTTGRRNRYIFRYSTDVSAINEKWRLIDGSETYMIGDISIRKREGYIRIEGVYNGVIT